MTVEDLRMTSCGTAMFDYNGDASIIIGNHCNCRKYIFSLRNHDKNAANNLNLFVKTVEDLRMTSCGTTMFVHNGYGSIVRCNHCNFLKYIFSLKITSIKIKK